MTRHGIGGHQRTQGRTNIWLTPPHILAALGDFDLDPCAAPSPRPWPVASQHYETDGLTLPWFGRVFMNPPYGVRVVGSWLQKMAHHGNGIALTFARTETAPCQLYVFPHADALLFLRGRLFFCHPDGRRAEDNGGAPSVLIAYGSANVETLRTCGLPGAFVYVGESTVRLKETA